MDATNFWKGFIKSAAKKTKAPNFIMEEAGAMGFGKQPPKKKEKKLKNPPPEVMASDFAVLGSQAMNNMDNDKAIEQKKTIETEEA